MRQILWIAALLGAYGIIQDGRHFVHHLGFYRKLEIVKNVEKLTFWMLDM